MDEVAETLSVAADKAIDVRSPEFRQSVFVCSKPLQFFHCASIVRHFNIPDPQIYINFEGIASYWSFREFLESSRYVQLFPSIVWSESYLAVAREIDRGSCESLFVPDDRVSMYLLFGRLPSRHLVLYEEGLGTYLGKYAYSMSLLKKAKWKILARLRGSGFEFGSGRRTSIVLVTKPDLFRSLHPSLAKKVAAFPGLDDELEVERDSFAALLDTLVSPAPRASGSSCLVLGTWGGTPGLQSVSDLSGFDLVYLKPHPHDASGAIEGAAIIADSWVPAELVVAYLATRSRSLDVLHYSSSTAFYAESLFPNVTFRNLRPESHLASLL